MQFLSLHTFWINNRVNYSLRFLIAFTCVVLPCWWYDYTQAMTPLILGVIAGALAETEDNFIESSKGLVITLICFALATFSIELLFNKPIIFAIGLLLSTFAFTMFGAMGNRYGNIAFASLLIAIYTMLVAQISGIHLEQAIYLICGAFGYGLISLLWLLIWPRQQAEQNLSQLYLALSRYLNNVSEHYYPSMHENCSGITVDDAKENASVVTALNNAKLSLLVRIRHGEVNQVNQQFLSIYFIAQDIHENINAVYSPPLHFSTAFFHSDVMFRLRHLFLLQSKACQQVANALLLGKQYDHSTTNRLALDELHSAILHFKQQCKEPTLINQLDTIWQTILRVENQLEHINNVENALSDEDRRIADSEAKSVREKFARLRSQLTPKSLLFRHAVRLSLSFVAGYALIKSFDLAHGYWILLTILLVCKPNYSTTRDKLSQRILGTVAGLALALPVLLFFPDTNSQLVLMVIFGVLFFSFRASHQTLANIFITLFVLMNFNQFSNGFEAILPRMLDTIIGCLLAALVVRYILPDWQANRMHETMSDAVAANRDYLAQIISQYRLGKRDCVHYRVARRNAHESDAALNVAMSNLMAEPDKYQSAIEERFRFLSLNHSLLGHISTLGAHRQQIDSCELYELAIKIHRPIFEALSTMHDLLLTKSSEPEIENLLNLTLDDDLLQQLAKWSAGNNHTDTDYRLAKILEQQFRDIAQLIMQMKQQVGLVMQQSQPKT